MTSVLKKIKLNSRKRKKIKVRSKVFGTSFKPRLSVFKSNKYVFVQLIDDSSGLTISSSFSKSLSGKTKSEKAKESGKELAKKALEKGIDKVVFDRGGFLYAGIIKAVAEGAREGGLKF